VSSQIIKLFGLIVALFALLIVFTSRWTVFEATSLNNNPLNKRPARCSRVRFPRGVGRGRATTQRARCSRSQSGI
jgi:peptidoglycan glycosyltransferase